MDVYLAYVDDSGDQQLDLMSAVLVPLAAWSDTLARWLEFRRSLEREFGIPVGYELHAAEFLNGRGRPSILPGAAVNTSRPIRRQIGERALRLLTDLGVRVITVARRGGQRRVTYGMLVDDIEGHLDRVDGQAIVVIDGDAQHPAYHRTHRDLKLAGRRVVEDPWMQTSRGSQLIQIADLVAYTAHQHLTRSSRHQPMWTWYEQYVAPLHVPGHPGLIRP